MGRPPRTGARVTAGWRPVDPPRQPVLFINPRSGGGKAQRAGLAPAAGAIGVRCVELGTGEDLSLLAEEAIAGGADALGMAGGDGSLAVVATAASAHDLPFVCLPAGTRNHFALDVGVIRSDLTGALAAFTDGVESSIDVGDVNGRMFLNNVSIGVYGEAVRHPGYRDAKARTVLETAWQVLGPSAAAPPIGVTDDRGRAHTHPAVVLISNNPYALGPPFAPGTRPRLDTGQLGIAILDRPERPADPAAHAWTAAAFEVRSSAPIHAGIDGEAVVLDPELRFASRPNALRVRIARRHLERSRAITHPA